MSILKDIADALAEGLAGKSWQSVDATPAVQRVNWPTYAVEDMADPVIAVVPSGDDMQRVDRTRFQHDYQVNVFIGRHTPTDADADDMLGLA